MLFEGGIKSELLSKMGGLSASELITLAQEGKSGSKDLSSSALETILFLIHILLRNATEVTNSMDE